MKTMKSRQLVAVQHQGVERLFLVEGAENGEYDLIEIIGVAERGRYRRKWQAVNAAECGGEPGEGLVS